MGQENRKRKREADEPRIKYHVEQSGRSFERILKENTREELCEIVRKKLNLDPKTNLELAQIREGVVYDLEDDEDFEAFKSAAYAYSSLDVRVSYSVDAIPQNASNTRAGPSSVSEASTNPEVGQRLEEHSTREHSLVTGASFDVDGNQSVVSNRSNRILSSAREEMAAPPKIKRKRDRVDSDPMTTAEGTKRKKTKVKESDAHSLNSAVPVEDADETPLRKKRKKGTEYGLETSGSPVDEKRISTADTSEVNVKSKTTKLKKLPADTPDITEDVSAKEFQVKKGEMQPMIDNRKSTKKRSSMTQTPVTATSDSAPAPVVTHGEPPLRLSVSHHPQLDPGTSTSDSVRLAYASLLRKPPRTAAEILDEYSSRKGSRTRTSVSVVDDIVTSTSTRVETNKKGESANVDIANDSVKDKKDKPKPNLAKGCSSGGWTSVDTEAPSSSSSKQLFVADSSKVADAATLPQPLTLPPHLARSIYSPRRGGPKSSPANAKLASPCPICLSLPIHFRFKCPVITSGAESIIRRIAQLKEAGGKEDLINELEEWLRKDCKKTMSKEAAQTETRSKPSPPAAAQSKHQDSPLPPWAPILSLQTHPSEVIVEGTNEGSESATSSSSEGGGDQSNSSTESSSISGSGSISPGVNLERVDLDSLIRGPSLGVAGIELLKVVDDNDEEEGEKNPEDDDVDVGFLEEEEEEEKPLPKRLRGLNLLRSKSPEALDGGGDEDEASESDVQQEPAAGISLRSSPAHPDQSVETQTSSVQEATDANWMVKETHPDQSTETAQSVQEATDGNRAEQDHGTTAADNVDTELLTNADTASHPSPGDFHATPGPLTADAPSSSSNVEQEGATGMAGVRSSVHSDHSLEPEPPVRDAPDRKGIEKDRGADLLANADATSHSKPGDFHATPGPSDAGAPSTSQPVGKRRGRPPLPDAVKAERKALKDAEKAAKAAKAAAERAKSEQKRRTLGVFCPPPMKKSNESVVASSTRTPLFLPGASQMSQSQVVPRFVALSSQETTEEAQQEREDSPSGSSSDEDSSKSAILRLHPASQSAFPSLSQLSFDKFKPSFLLTNFFSQSQNNVKHSGAPLPDDESEEEDESSDSEQESHIPKDKRAGAGIVKRPNSRGLLH